MCLLIAMILVYFPLIRALPPLTYENSLGKILRVLQKFTIVKNVWYNWSGVVTTVVFIYSSTSTSNTKGTSE